MKDMSGFRFELSRQIVHISGILFIIFAQFIGRETTILYFSLIAAFFFLYSWYIRNQEKRVQNMLSRMESRFRDFTLKFERKDANPFMGAMFFYIGCTIAFIVFPFNIASAAGAMLAVGDSLSTIVGTRLGRHKIGKTNKSFEGSAACFVGSLLAGVIFVAPHIAVLGAIAAAAAELLPKINDNLSIPVVSGLVMLILTMF
ncbi:MAG: SEC59/DGK1/VTE5 family protein [Candidatus Aenigmarchaeota archaeon]|nr:SEC59/DGK1/VTE5 family protein [Candidatus Aenigmarchaeota archaeon]